MGGAIKLGIAAAVGYTVGGRIGPYVAKAAGATELDTLKGAQWGGRIAVFLGAAYLLGR